MGLEISGQTRRIVARSGVVSNDSTAPSGGTQTGSVAVPGNAKGARVHILLDGVASASGISVVAHLYGYNESANTWYFLDTLNNGVAIDQSLSNVDDGNNLHYAEVTDHASAYDRLFVALTGIAGTNASFDIAFVFEQLHRG